MDTVLKTRMFGVRGLVLAGLALGFFMLLVLNVAGFSTKKLTSAVYWQLLWHTIDVRPPANSHPRETETIARVLLEEASGNSEVLYWKLLPISESSFTQRFLDCDCTESILDVTLPDSVIFYSGISHRTARFIFREEDGQISLDSVYLSSMMP